MNDKITDLQNQQLDIISKEYYDNGNIKEITNYKNNMREGEGIRYYPNGSVKEINIYKNDKLQKTKPYFCGEYEKQQEHKIRVDEEVAQKNYRIEEEYEFIL